MRLLVVGGGVAGPAVALAATRLGLDAAVLERRPVADPDEGSWVTVAPNGLDALDVLGVLDDARAVGHPSRANRMFGATGRHLGDVLLGAPLADGSVALTVKRSALAALLADAASRQGADVRLGAEVVSVEDDERGVRAVLADGSVAEGDVLVAADGVRSRVRRAIDPRAPNARYVGLTNFGGITRGTNLATGLTPEAWHFVFGRRSFFGAHPLPTGDVGDSTYDLPHVPTWWRGRTVLVGDAAHAPSPSSGQGAAMALEDAVVLARSLATHGTGGLTTYEQARRKRVEAIVRAGARSSSAKIPGKVGRVVMETMLSALFRTGVAARSTASVTAHRLGPDPLLVRKG